MLETLSLWTEDGLNLPGFHYASNNKEACVLLIHGMSGNFLENKFAWILGEKLSENGIGFIYAHNRGHSHINDISIKDINPNGSHKTIRVGATYERFEDSLYDVNAWVSEAKRLGYKKIILAGHSLGANKVIHYIFKKNPNLAGLILLSSPDMVANAKESGRSEIYEILLKEAKDNISTGNPRKLLSKQLWDWHTLSSQTFLDLFEDFGPADNLPLMRNPDNFPELQAVKFPTLAVMGEFDDIAVRTLEKDMDLLEKKATNTKSFTKKFIPKATHTYENGEEQLAKVILAWLKQTLFL